MEENKPLTGDDLPPEFADMLMERLNQADDAFNAEMRFCADEFARLREERDAAEDARKTFNKQLDALEIRMINLMATVDLQSMDFKGVGKFHQRVSEHASINKAKQKEFLEWLVANGFGDIIKPTVHNQTLGAWYREQRAEAEDNGTTMEFLAAVVESDMLKVDERVALVFTRDKTK